MLKLKTKQAMEEASEVPLPARKRMKESKAEAGARGKVWSSSRGRNQRLIGDCWCICISVELCCFISQEHSDACTILHNSLTAGFVLQISYLPACERDPQLSAVLPLHPPAWQPFPCNSTITIQVTSESSTDRKATLMKRLAYTEPHLKSPRSLPWGSCRYWKIYSLAWCVFSMGITLVSLQLGNVTTVTELRFNYQGEKTP